MPELPIHNETDYDLTPRMLIDIQHDAMEYFGEAIRVIRVQQDIERLAFNAKTGELRYPFFPSDYGFGDAIALVSEPGLSKACTPSIDADLEDFAPPDYDDDAVANAVAILQDTVDVRDEEDDPTVQRLDIDVDAIEGAAHTLL